jgi:hypothetical protein
MGGARKNESIETGENERRITPWRSDGDLLMTAAQSKVKTWPFNLKAPALNFFANRSGKQRVIRRSIDAEHTKKGDKKDDEAQDRNT